MQCALGIYYFRRRCAIKITPLQLAKRVERWQKLLTPLGIAHFRIEFVAIVDETPAGDHAAATVQVSDNYDTVKMWFTNDLLYTCDERELDETIIHEWLHVAMRDLDQSLQCVAGWMPRQTYYDFTDNVDRAREGLIDRMSRALYALHTES